MKIEATREEAKQIEMALSNREIELNKKIKDLTYTPLNAKNAISIKLFKKELAITILTLLKIQEKLYGWQKEIPF